MTTMDEAPYKNNLIEKYVKNYIEYLCFLVYSNKTRVSYLDVIPILVRIKEQVIKYLMDKKVLPSYNDDLEKLIILMIKDELRRNELDELVKDIDAPKSDITRITQALYIKSLCNYLSDLNNVTPTIKTIINSINNLELASHLNEDNSSEYFNAISMKYDSECDITVYMRQVIFLFGLLDNEITKLMPKYHSVKEIIDSLILQVTVEGSIEQIEGLTYIFDHILSSLKYINGFYRFDTDRRVLVRTENEL